MIYETKPDIFYKIEEDIVNLSEETQKFLMHVNPKNALTMRQWVSDFADRRKTNTEALSAILEDHPSIPPYPPASLLEMIQRDYSFNTQREYAEIMSRLSFFRRGEIKIEIKRNWGKWIKDMSKIISNHIEVNLKNQRGLFFENLLKNDQVLTDSTVNMKMWTNVYSQIYN